MPQRVNKYLAHQLGISRRQADAIIAKGSVTINGQPATPGNQIQDGDQVKIGETLVSSHHVPMSYVLLNKPVGYVCSRKSQGSAPTIYELLPENMHSLKPVGRLDKDSSGLLLLTNDGDFAFRMTHPKFHKTKTYHVSLDAGLQPLHRQMISDHGIMLEDGPSKLQLERQVEGDDTKWIVRMHEGRNRQIRRTFASLGYTVIKLHRTEFGPFWLGDIKAGAFTQSVKN